MILLCNATTLLLSSTVNVLLWSVCVNCRSELDSGTGTRWTQTCDWQLSCLETQRSASQQPLRSNVTHAKTTSNHKLIMSIWRTHADIWVDCNSQCTHTDDWPHMNLCTLMCVIFPSFSSYSFFDKTYIWIKI